MKKKTTSELRDELSGFDTTYKPGDSDSCADRAILLLRIRQAEVMEVGRHWEVDFDSCRREIMRAIKYKDLTQSKIEVAMEYVSDKRGASTIPMFI